MQAIIVALITGGLTLIGTVITVLAASHKTAEDLKTAQAVTDTKLEELTREVRAHNNFAQRMPVVENDIKTIYKRLDKVENDGR